jgi:error-prone DNA polymerase
MVHPYLRRRNGEEAADLPGSRDDPEELKDVLGKTLGVPLFQEQAMKLAIIAAHFTPPEANALRRSMATFRSRGTMGDHQHRLIAGMVRRGYTQEFAERCAKQIEGFGDYGFPESHAQAFAWLAYVSSWLKCHHPAVFTCALLNSQPMGFYAPAQLVRDAQEHEVEVRTPDINHSLWDNTLERRTDGALALRLGFRQIDGFRRDWADEMVAARVAEGRFTDLEDCARRCDVDRRALRLASDGDAMQSLNLGRRKALWSSRRVVKGTLPLFEAAGLSDQGEEADMALPIMPAGEEVAVDYQTLRLSLKGHPLQFLRGTLEQEGVMTTAAVNAARNDTWVKTAGLVLVRQRPGNGKAIFITLEDETGIANALLWERLFARYRRPVMAARLMLITGQVQRSKEDVVHLMARRIEDRSELLSQLFEDAPDYAASQHAPAPRARHPRNVRLIPKSRDFH